MAASFKFDTSDVNNIPGLARAWNSDEPFLTPVFFNSGVLVRYFYDPRFRCEFSSETYGQIGDVEGSWDLVFGINPNGLVFAWLGDIRKLSDEVQEALCVENVASDHLVDSDFYDAQISIAYTDPIKEVELLLLKVKVSNAFNERFGGRLYKTSDNPTVNEVRAYCSRYKRIAFNHEDDLKRFVSEWFELLVEDMDLKVLRRALAEAGHEVHSKLGELKTLEHFTSAVLGDESNRIGPLFYLADLRVWADHRGANRHLAEAYTSLGLDKAASREDLYRALVAAITGFVKWLQVSLCDGAT